MKLTEKFEVHDTLNPKLFNADYSLKSDVREKLLEIADDFTSDLILPIAVVDVQLVGSNASFNYTQYSDVDLHLIANFDAVLYSDMSKEELQNIYLLQKTKYNNKYEITIKDIPVEIYVEDMTTSAVSNGIYSVKSDKWIKFPKKIVLDKDVDVSREFEIWKKYIEKSIEKEGKSEKALNDIYLIRKNSIAVDGEYGKGNILFKDLRNAGLLDKLRDQISKEKAKELSLESLKENYLSEATRTQLLDKSKNSVKGRQRLARKNKSKVSSSTREFNKIDMNRLFKDGILTVDISVRGETDNYSVRISFGGFLDILRNELKRKNDILDLQVIVRALKNGFDRDDVYVGCNCPDFYYRFGYVATKNKYNSIEPQLIPANIRNPHDTLGSACKHTLLVLSNNSWIIKCASVINNYINYMKNNYQKLYADVIYPAIYGKKYDADVQMRLDDTEDGTLDTSTGAIDKANVHQGRDERGRFSKGNTSGVRFSQEEKDDDNTIQLT